MSEPDVLLDGDALLHTDLQPGNLLANDDAVTVIDRAWASRGSAPAAVRHH